MPVFTITEHTIPCQFLRESPRATANGEDASLSLAVKQYTPLTPCDPSFQKITVVGAHGNGFPKELYEPLWEDLHSHLLQHKIGIQNIWIADAVHQGASGVLNEEKLGNEASFFDQARDIIYMINQFQSQMTLPIIGIGHSMGATHLLQASLIHSRLFHGLILIEPVLYDVPQPHVRFGPAYLAATRRDRWASREEFITHARRSKAYGAWDGRVLERWFEFGVREVASASACTTPGASSEVVLRTSKHQETFALARPNRLSAFPTAAAGGEVHAVDRALLPHVDEAFLQPEPVVIFHNLPFVRPAVVFMFGALSEFLSAGGMRERAVERTGASILGSCGVAGGRVRRVEIEDAGHMAPAERPDAIATEIAGWVGGEMRVWREEQERVRVEWRGKTGEEKRRMDGGYLGHLGLADSIKKGRL